MGSPRVYYFTFLVLSMLCYSIAFSPKSLQNPSNNERSNEKASILPKLDISRLEEDDKITVRKIAAFTIKFVRRAYRVAKMSAERKNILRRRFEKDYNREYEKLEPRMAALENRRYDESLMARLKAFLNAFRMLHQKILCILYGCDVPTTTLIPTTEIFTTTEPGDYEIDWIDVE